MEIFDRVKAVFRDVFNDPKLEITEDTFADEIEEWDSLANIMIIAAIEKEFKIKFDLREIIVLGNVGDVVDLIKRKLKNELGR